MSKNEETWAALLGCTLVSIIFLIKLAIAGLVIWGIIEAALWLGRN